MNDAYIAARLRQIDWMRCRVANAKQDSILRSLRNPLSGRPLGERAALFALRRNNEYNDLIEQLTDEQKKLRRESLSSRATNVRALPPACFAGHLVHILSELEGEGNDPIALGWCEP